MLGRISVVGLALLSVSCGDQLRYGYVNRLPYAVTVVRHYGRDVLRTPVRPNHCQPGGSGPNMPFDIVAGDRVLARYRPSQIPVHTTEPLGYYVISRDGVSVESRDVALRGLPKECWR
jgi:hypothetical protein